MKIRDVMTKDVVSVGKDAPLKDAARTLVEKGVTGMPVLDVAGDVIGVISEADIIAKETQPRARHRALDWLLDPRDDWLDDRFAARTVAQAMSAPAITIEADRPLTEAANVMVAEGVNRLPVVADGELVGIVTRADLVRAFARSDDEIRTEIREEVISRVFWLDPTHFTVEVKDGMVTLTGQVETEADVRLLPELVRRLPGVVAVEAKVTARDVVHAR